MNLQVTQMLLPSKSPKGSALWQGSEFVQQTFMEDLMCTEHSATRRFKYFSIQDLTPHPPPTPFLLKEATWQSTQRTGTQSGHAVKQNHKGHNSAWKLNGSFSKIISKTVSQEKMLRGPTTCQTLG